MKTEAEIEALTRIFGQLREIQGDFEGLSGKKPSEAINLFKLSRVNDFLSKANVYLIPGYQPFEDFETFNKDDLPTNSDVLLMLNQYLWSLKRFIRDNTIVEISGPRFWVLDGKKSKVIVNLRNIELT